MRGVDRVNADEMKDKILTALEAVIDPELGIDIVNLGLIYEVELDEDGLCTIKMTLTTMGCPLTDYLSDQINQAVMQIPEVKDVEIDLVWYPQWTPELMSRYARISLGIG
ncbi:metal-sulfur cluster assembly factor [Lapidilactobacillus wuchangensis]|uniref:metal-sulfur cluster assembly factor n=1 Tax=Lapidilactobacillus wuchangensis TaxID=2486001 RepID=UPI000F782D03|nr:metal-sulfur cluster assembly factor [Lapidilactobacillus wuchangensis]